MKRLKPILLFAVLAALITLSIPAPVRSAETFTSPIVLIKEGDLFSLAGPDQPLVRLTDYGRNSDPVISPDGKYVVYRSVPKFVIDEEKQNGPRAGLIPADLWIIELATGKGDHIAAQPADARYASVGVKPRYMLRPAPAWSPDSKALVWNELWAEDQFLTEHVMVYTLATQKSKEIVSKLPAEISLYNGTTPSWGKGGIMFVRHYPDTVSSPAADYVLVYSPEGTLQRRVVLPNSICPCEAGRWAISGKKEAIYFTAGLKEFVVMPDSRENTPFADRLVTISPSAPDGLAVFTSLKDNKTIYTILDSASDKPLEVGEIDHFSIAPNGTQIAIIKDNKLYIYQDGKAPEIKLDLKIGESISDMAWGYIGYKIVKK